MELDEFKLVLRAKLEADASPRSAPEIVQYVSRKTTSIIAKIKRSMVYEFIFGVVCVIACVFVFYKSSSFYVRLSCIAATVFCGCLLIYMIRLYNKISFFEKNALSIKESIREILEILRRFTKLYFQLSIFMLPVAFVIGLIIGYMDVLQQDLDTNFKWGRGILFYCACYLFWSIFMYFFSKWYIKKLYGNYLEQLKGQLTDLENG